MLKVANSVISASRITGVLPVVNGGTGVTTSTGTGNTVLSATPTLSGDVSLSTGNLVIATSGKGIDFSATAHPAGMTSELLADYEEGTWTPAYSTSGTQPTVTYLVQVGHYVKVGKLVFWSSEVTITGVTGGTGSLLLSGLPFTSGASRFVGGGSTSYGTGWTTAMPTTGYVYSGGTVVDLQSVGATAVVATPIANLTNSAVYLNMYGSYIST